MDPTELRHALGTSAVPAGDSYVVRQLGEGLFAGRSPRDRASVLLSLKADTNTPGRSFQGLEVRFAVVTYEVGGRKWTGPAAAFECTNDQLLPTFCALILDGVGRLFSAGAAPPGAMSPA